MVDDYIQGVYEASDGPAVANENWSSDRWDDSVTVMEGLQRV